MHTSIYLFMVSNMPTKSHPLSEYRQYRVDN